MTGRTPNPIGVVKKVIEGEQALGDFIANGPSTGLPGWVRDQYRKRCDQYANLPGWARALPEAAGGGLGRTCKPWYDSQGRTGPSKTPPFTGGQCDNLLYAVNYFRSRPEGPDFGGQLYARGPITERSVTFIGNFQYRLIFRGSAGFDQTTVNVLAGEPPPTFGPITPLNGQPDNCGDPPADLAPGTNPPPDPGPTSGPEPSVDPANPTGPPLLPIPPYIDPIGGPTPIDAPVDPTGGGGGPGNSEGQPGGPQNIGQGLPVDPGDGDDPETPFGDPPEGSVWVGCLLNFTFPAEYGSIAGSGPQNEVLARTVGNGSLVFAGGRGNAEIVRSSWQSLMRPTPALEVTGVFVNVSPGITYTVFPVSVESCPENLCE